MKRGQEWAEGIASSSTQKSPRIETNNPQSQIAAGSYDVDYFSLMPDRPYQRVIGFLSLGDKKNLNLCSKACSRRIRMLGDSVQNWRINISSNYEETMITLMTAKIKNISDGTIDNIQLHLQFHDQKDIIVADNMINHWKNNIVDLTIPISPKHIFLMDPNLKLPNLMNLKLTDVGNSNDLYDYLITGEVVENANTIDEHRPDKLKISTDFVEKHVGSLKSLCIGNVPVQIKKLTKLEKFSINCGDLNMFSSYLTATSQTLVNLSWGWSIPPKLPDQFIHPELLRLKELTLNNIPTGLVGAILRSCRKTLQVLTINGQNRACGGYGGNTLAILDLPVVKLVAEDIPSGILNELLHASRTTLQEFVLGNEGTCFEYQDKELPNTLTFSKLIIFKCSSTPEIFSMSVVKSAKKTLKHFSYNRNNLNIGTLHGGVKLPLTHFHAHDLSYRFILQIVKASKLSLEELTISLLEEKFKLGNTKLNLKRLKCSRTNSDVVFSLISAASASLQHLEVKKILYDNLPVIWTENMTQVRVFNYSLEKLQLKSLKCEFNFNLSNPIVSSVIVSSCDTLESLSLTHTGSFHDQVRSEFLFDDEQVKFSINGLTQMQLKNFQCKNVPATVVSSVIAFSGYTLQSLELIGVKKPGDFTLAPNMSLPLREFSATNLSPKIVADIITSSCSTLKVLKLDRIKLVDDDNPLLHQNRNSFKLEELTILNSSSNVARQFITELISPLKILKIKNVKGEDKSDVLVLISRYKEAHPFCHVDTRDEKSAFFEDWM